ncbi:MAG: ribbon-helix-helix protein, CopG family, partial [Thermoprotei archaeon]
MRIVTFKLDEITLRKLDELASKLGISRSEIIRLAL